MVLQCVATSALPTGSILHNGIVFLEYCNCHCPFLSQVCGSHSGAIWRLTLATPVRMRAKVTVVVVSLASGPKRLTKLLEKAASSYHRLRSVSKHPGPV